MAARNQIAHWRAQIFNRLLLAVFVLGLATAIPSAVLAIGEGLWSIVVIDIVALSWMAAILLLRQLPYPLRAMNFLLMAFLFGIGLMLKIGAVSQIYLMAVPILAALLVGLRPAIWFLLASGLAILTLGYDANSKLHLEGLPDYGLLKSGIITLNYLFVGAVLTLSCGVLLRHLARSLDEIQDAAETLEHNEQALLTAIEARDRTAAEIKQLAFYDPLTGLPNRRLLLDRLAGLLASSERNGTISAVMFVDLDRFKFINDARGHATGDAVLKHAAERLSLLVRKVDTVARIGGDEFVVLLAHLAPEMTSACSAAQLVADKIRVHLAEGFDIDGQVYLSSASIGVSLLPRFGRSADDLLREADTAMYRAKASGRNGVAFFEAAMQAEVERRLTLERDLAEAIDGRQLSMHFQPQFDHGGRLHGAELLMRWQRSDGSMVPPATFIPLAEETGMIVRLGMWALREACRAQRQMAAGGHALPLSVNVSPHQFRQPDFVQQVRQTLHEGGMAPTLLILEVTEGLLIDKLDDTVARMHELAALGVRFSIDDFGTGYSSLAYLKKMPLYELKVDRSFMQDTPYDPSSTAIVQSILAMARHLGLRVVAEGVETRAQADFLAANGCDAMQGFLLARPAPLPALLVRLGEQDAAWPAVAE
jgi:diguanylate cyclase (GGDEF)-like protein